MTVDNYIETVFSKYKKTPELLSFKEEVSTNLHEAVNTKRREGQTETAAVESAIKDMGDLSELLKSYPKSFSVTFFLRLVAWVSVIVGILIFLLVLTFDPSMYYGGSRVLQISFLTRLSRSLAVLHVFIDIQVPYLVWERTSRRRTWWRHFSILTLGAALLFGLDVLSSLTHHLATMGPLSFAMSNWLNSCSGEIVIVLAAVAATVFLLIRDKQVSGKD